MAPTTNRCFLSRKRSVSCSRLNFWFTVSIFLQSLQVCDKTSRETTTRMGLKKRLTSFMMSFLSETLSCKSCWMLRLRIFQFSNLFSSCVWCVVIFIRIRLSTIGDTYYMLWRIDTLMHKMIKSIDMCNQSNDSSPNGGRTVGQCFLSAAAFCASHHRSSHSNVSHYHRCREKTAGTQAFLDHQRKFMRGNSQVVRGWIEVHCCCCCCTSERGRKIRFSLLFFALIEIGGMKSYWQPGETPQALISRHSWGGKESLQSSCCSSFREDDILIQKVIKLISLSTNKKGKQGHEVTIRPFRCHTFPETLCPHKSPSLMRMNRSRRRNGCRTTGRNLLASWCWGAREECVVTDTFSGWNFMMDTLFYLQLFSWKSLFSLNIFVEFVWDSLGRF